MIPLIHRQLPAPQKTFLLLGPRGTGINTTWLRAKLTPKVFINLLHSEVFSPVQGRSIPHSEGLSATPTRRLGCHRREVQRVPELLNEIHRLYETQGLHFAITGSSARRLKRSHANLLAGRATRCDFFPFVLAEFENDALIDWCTDYKLPPLIVL